MQTSTLVLNTLDEFSLWQYRDDHNCWDFVREYLLHYTDIPAEHLPRFGILPNDKRSMTRASLTVARNFVECEPQNFAIAAHYREKLLLHVGVVYQGSVRHTSSQFGALSQSIAEFESVSHATTYFIHKSYADT